MNQEIRDKVVDLMLQYKLEPLEIVVSGIEKLIPQWRTFSPACLPDKGKEKGRILIQGVLAGRAIEYYWNDVVKKWQSSSFEMDEEYLIQHSYQWYPIP